MLACSVFLLLVDITEISRCVLTLVSNYTTDDSLGEKGSNLIKSILYGKRSFHVTIC